MNKYEKIYKKAEKIIKISGLYVSIKGDPDFGTEARSWVIKNDFYFDNMEELDEFKNSLKIAFSTYCGDEVDILPYKIEYETET